MQKNKIFDTFNTTLLLNLTIRWGISILNPINYQVNSFNYYIKNNNNDNNYIDNNNNIIEYYQPPNFDELSSNVTARFGNSIFQYSGNFDDVVIIILLLEILEIMILLIIIIVIIDMSCKIINLIFIYCKLRIIYVFYKFCFYLVFFLM